jgi:hypothetical protein
MSKKGIKGINKQWIIVGNFLDVKSIVKVHSIKSDMKFVALNFSVIT